MFKPISRSLGYLRHLPSLFAVCLALSLSGLVYADETPLNGIESRVLEIDRGTTKIQLMQIVAVGGQQYWHVSMPLVESATERVDFRWVSHEEFFVLIGRRVVQGLHTTDVPPVTYFEEIRITIPQRRYSMSWDVKALEKELERLGVKSRPLPSVPQPKPLPPTSGGA